MSDKECEVQLSTSVRRDEFNRKNMIFIEHDVHYNLKDR